MQRIRQFFAKRQEQSGKKKERDSKKVLLDELFNDLYNDRKRIYKVNFIRGIVFGVGSAIGGTVALALIVWLLSLFVNLPLVGQLFENTQNTINQTSEQASQEARD